MKTGVTIPVAVKDGKEVGTDPATGEEIDDAAKYMVMWKHTRVDAFNQ
jgi:hypothetical protein